MSILQKLRNMIGLKPRAATIADYIREGAGSNTSSGIAINDTNAMKVAAAWRCVNIISGALSSLPIDLVERKSEKERQPAIGHPLRRVLTVKPNHWQTSGEFRRLMQNYLLLRGNAYAKKIRMGGKVAALLPLHPDKVQVEQKDDSSLEYVVTGKTGSPIKMSSKEIFHLRGMSLDGITGLSTLSYMREALGLSLRGEQANANLLRSGNLANGTLEHPGRLTDEAYNRLKDSWNTGADDAGKTKVLEEGMKFNPVAMSAADAQFLESRDFQRYDIAMFFGVPPHMIGATDKMTSWGSGIETQGIGFVTYTLMDWFRIWEEGIKRDCLDESEWDRYDVRFYAQGLLRGDTKTRWDGYTKGLQWGVLSPNEVRALEDMNPREGGDEYYDPPNTAGGAEDQPSKETGDEPQPKEAAQS
jgi:HK97 family phage portal protein